MIPDKQGRIDAVATDFKRKRRRFAKIGPGELADALSLDLYGPASCMNAIWECSLDDFVDEFPAWDHLELFRGANFRKRYDELKAQGQDIAEYERGTNRRVKYWEIIIENLRNVGWNCGSMATTDGKGRPI
jgi:hypothetical protein